MTTFAVHYMKPEFFRDGIMGYKWLREHGPMPSIAALDKTHVELKTMEFQFVDGELNRALNKVFHDMQGEVWSPNGEANALIEAKGLQHTSMSVGDIVVVDGSKMFLVDRFGFKQIEQGV
jgi:hypothetical protein